MGGFGWGERYCVFREYIDLDFTLLLWPKSGQTSDVATGTITSGTITKLGVREGSYSIGPDGLGL